MKNDNLVFVVDDDDDFRRSLIWLLEGAGFQVRGFTSGEDFLSFYEFEPGVLLLDVRMKGMSGLTLQQELTDRGCALPIIILTGHGDVSMAVQAMKNQAFDFIEKPFDDEVLLARVRQALASCDKRFREQERRAAAISYWDSLSRREKEVAELVVAGSANRQIADSLSISIKTVEIHRSRVMAKMHAGSLAELVKMSGYILEQSHAAVV